MNFIDITSDDEQEVVLHPTFRNAAIAAGRGLRGMEDGEDEVHPIPVGESSDDGAVACPRCHRRLFIVASSSDEEDNYTEDSLGTGESLGGSEELLPKKRDASGRYHTSRMGEDTMQGQRSDLASAASLVRQGASMKEVAELDPVVFVRAYKGLTALQSILHPPKAVDRKVGLFVGATETGKTRMVFDELINVYTVFDLKNPWFDGYQGEANVLLDECGPGMMNHNFLKRLLDRYPMTVPIKGGSVAWNASTIVMTSNVPLDEWYERLPYADLQALKRRVKIFEFPKDKELARAWISGSLIRPEKRERIVEVESEDDIPVVSTQDKTQDLYDLCYVD